MLPGPSMKFRRRLRARLRSMKKTIDTKSSQSDAGGRRSVPGAAANVNAR